ncbi:MAG: VIT domain-containing protein [Rhodobacteraceae bacterium]|nr:VIT domain-containing protein [Paracoccaceae bacterium]
MQASALGHRLETLHDGLITFCNGEAVPIPLVATAISVRVLSGLAFVRMTRTFRNSEANPIEAVMTFPVGFDAVVTGLAATIDGRRMVGVAKERAEARETYEAALDEGRLSVLHEEALRGIHVLSVGALPPGVEVEVELEQTVPLVDVGGVPFLRLPMTAGQLYGTSPLLPSDDLVTAAVQHVAQLSVTVDAGRAVLEGRTLTPGETQEILLDRALELRIEGGGFGALGGVAADGRRVRLTLASVGAGEAELDLHVIVDRSGSTSSPVREGTVSIWEAMRDGLAVELAALRDTDRVALWQFDSECQLLGVAGGATCAKLVNELEGPRGGTELAGAVRAAVAEGAKDILVLTDGQTWADMVEDLKRAGPRISAILAGPQSLDANIGHLCAMTGGQVLYAPGRDVGSALRSAFAALRQAGAAVRGEVEAVGPREVTALRGGVTLRAEWLEGGLEGTTASDAVGRFAASLALPLLPTDTAEAFARAHSLCTHMTSLVLVDDAGDATEGFSRMRKVPLMSGRAELPVRAYMSPEMLMGAVPVQRPGRLTAYRQVTDAALVKRTGFLELRRDAVPEEPTGGAEGRSNKGEKTNASLRRWQPDLSKFDGFAWDQHGDALLSGDLASLSGAQRAVVEGLALKLRAADPDLATAPMEMAKARRLALGLIADRKGGRLAERFARRALQGAPDWVSSTI